MPHVFVESNWIFGYAAPAHHQSPAAVKLLERAGNGEFTLHIPKVLNKCQPRNEVNAIRKFLAHGESNVLKRDATVVRTVLNQYTQSIQRDLGHLDEKLKLLHSLPYVRLFGLNDEMLRRATQLELEGIHLKPYDQAILAGVLIGGERLWNSGERMLSFCDTDEHLHPWDKEGRVKTTLLAAYDNAHLWVYEDFTLTTPSRRPRFG